MMLAIATRKIMIITNLVLQRKPDVCFIFEYKVLHFHVKNTTAPSKSVITDIYLIVYILLHDCNYFVYSAKQVNIRI